MNDREYIRKAVELADGFQLTGDGKHFSLPHGNYLPAIKNCPQQYLDALAAQLVRQVDATNYEVRMQACATTIFYGGKEFWQLGGKGRTMNTIKAIVDSGVLSCGL